MKIILFVAVFFMTAASSGVLAEPTPLTPILTAYYQVKDALVAGDAKAAAAAAAGMLNAINGVDMRSMVPNDHLAFMSVENKLASDARQISGSSDIRQQRDHFTTLSANLYALARQAPMSQQPIYEDYCPMKKAYWLSADMAIKNPYFGSDMPDCGKIAATLKPRRS